MLTYYDVVQRVKGIFKKEFNIDFDNFTDEVKLNSLGFTGARVKELEDKLCEEFEIYNLRTLYDEEATIGEVANEILEESGLNYNGEDSLFFLYIIVAIAFGTLFLLLLL